MAGYGTGVTFFDLTGEEDAPLAFTRQLPKRPVDNGAKRRRDEAREKEETERRRRAQKEADLARLKSGSVANIIDLLSDDEQPKVKVSQTTHQSRAESNTLISNGARRLGQQNLKHAPKERSATEIDMITWNSRSISGGTSQTDLTHRSARGPSSRFLQRTSSQSDPATILRHEQRAKISPSGNPEVGPSRVSILGARHDSNPFAPSKGSRQNRSLRSSPRRDSDQGPSTEARLSLAKKPHASNSEESQKKEYRVTPRMSQSPRQKRDVSHSQPSELRTRKVAAPTPDLISNIHIPDEFDSQVLPTPALTPATLPEPPESLDQLSDEHRHVSLHIDNIERVLRGHLAALDEHQESLVTSRLESAEQQHRCFTGPTVYKSNSSPFRNLFANKQPAVTSSKLSQSTLLMQTSPVPAKPGKKPVAIYANSIQLIPNAQQLPKVKSIGRLGISRDILARNVQTLTYMPWFPENETETATVQEKKRYDELEERYNNNIKTRSLMRRCRAISNMWKPEMIRIIKKLGISCSDLVYYMFHEDEKEQPARGTLSPAMEALWNDRSEDCPSCEIGEYSRSADFKRIAYLLNRPRTERRLAMAGLLCEVFYRVVKVNIWHVVSEMDDTVRILQDCLAHIQRNTGGLTDHIEFLCYACGQFSCTLHGAYVDADDSVSDDSSIDDELAAPRARRKANNRPSRSDSRFDIVPQGEVVLDDPELHANSRQHATLPLRPLEHKPTGKHSCGMFCISPDTPVEEIVGLHYDGTVSGALRGDLLDDGTCLFDDSTLCDNETCFWETSHRCQTDFERLLDTYEISKSKFLSNQADYELLRSLLPMSLRSKRGPCELALAVSKASCLEIFYFMLCTIRSSPHETGSAPAAHLKQKETAPDISNDKHLEDRTNFVPCSHLGPCHPSKCACAVGKISCESNCGCSSECMRRFKGCACREGRRKVCFEDSRCECWANNRECDPGLCAGCGVQQILDPVNRGSDDNGSRCRNNRIQLGIPKRTVMGVSEVHGWGLYAGEDIAKSDFISEYKGELISILEGNRRGAVYHNLGLEYLFKLSNDQELDGSRFSNKSRFINNSSQYKNINVLSKKLLCNGVSRIMLYAARDIAAGEELFYNYGYDKQVRENFKEKPDLTKKSSLLRTLSTTTSFTAPSLTSSTTPSDDTEHVSSFAHSEADVGDLDDEPIPSTTDPGSEFDASEDASEVSSASDKGETDVGVEESDKIDVKSILGTSSAQHRPSSKDGPSSSSKVRRDLSAPVISPNNRPRKRAKLLTPTQQRHSLIPVQESKSNASLRRRTFSRPQSYESPANDKELSSKRMLPDQRKRVVSTNDKRLGGEAQRRAAATRRARLEAERQASERAEAVKHARKKRKRNHAASPGADNVGSSQPLPVNYENLQVAAEARHFPPKVLTASEWYSDDLSVSMSESSRSVSSNKQLATDMAAQNSSFASSTSKPTVPSARPSASTQSIPHRPPQQEQPVRNGASKEQRRKMMPGYGAT